MHLTYLKDRVKEAVERNVGSFQWQVGKHEEPFIEAFHEHRDKIVYLSPDSPNVLEALNPEHIYIIGGIADVHIQKVLAHMPHANCSPPCANLVARSLCCASGYDAGQGRAARHSDGLSADQEVHTSHQNRTQHQPWYAHHCMIWQPVRPRVRHQLSPYTTMRTVIEIMTNVAETGDWPNAFEKSIPTRYKLHTSQHPGLSSVYSRGAFGDAGVRTLVSVVPRRSQRRER
jgi:hypothetical protein